MVNREKSIGITECLTLLSCHINRCHYNQVQLYIPHTR